jgi:hypothetical protein
VGGGHDPDCRKSFPWDESKWDKDLFEFAQACSLVSEFTATATTEPTATTAPTATSTNTPEPPTPTPTPDVPLSTSGNPQGIRPRQK